MYGHDHRCPHVHGMLSLPIIFIATANWVNICFGYEGSSCRYRSSETFNIRGINGIVPGLRVAGSCTF